MQPQYITLSKRMKDLTGQRFGRLVALGCVGKTHHRKILWHCQCDCGNEAVVRTNSLVHHGQKSCGCLQRETSAKNGKKSTTHGEAAGKRTPTYRSWKNMNSRCRNYPRYVERGITVCDRWINSYENFLSDMGRRPEGTSLDRINNDGNYEPENCRWATMEQQARNKSDSRYITFNGETLTHGEWSLRLGGARTLVGGRIRNGWSEADAVSRPKREFAT